MENKDFQYHTIVLSSYFLVMLEVLNGKEDG